MKNKFIFAISSVLLFVFLVGGAFALDCDGTQLGTFKFGETINLRQICDTCTYVTLGSVTYPNSTISPINDNMTKSGVDYLYSYTPGVEGVYYYTVYGNKGGSGTILAETFCFAVTPTGIELTQAKTVLYVLIWIISFLMFLGLLIYGMNIDGNNTRDQMTGYILDVSNLKYLKIFSLALSYVFLVFISYFTWMISFAYLDMEFMSKILQFIFYALAIATLPLFILFVYLLIANKVRDSKIQEALSRGLRIK